MILGPGFFRPPPGPALSAGTAGARSSARSSARPSVRPLDMQSVPWRPWPIAGLRRVVFPGSSHFCKFHSFLPQAPSRPRLATARAACREHRARQPFDAPGRPGGQHGGDHPPPPGSGGPPPGARGPPPWPETRHLRNGTPGMTFEYRTGRSYSQAQTGCPASPLNLSLEWPAPGHRAGNGLSSALVMRSAAAGRYAAGLRSQEPPRREMTLTSLFY